MGRIIFLLAAFCVMRTQANLRKRFDEAMTIFNTAEAAKYDAYLAEDTELWPPHGPAIIGMKAVNEELAKNTFKDLGAIEFSNVKVKMMGGDWGYVTSTFTASADGIEYKDLMIWKKESGQWVLKKDVWSPNAK